jgi:hypothetical protein
MMPHTATDGKAHIYGLKSGKFLLSKEFVTSNKCGDWDDVRAYRYQAERAAILVYTHFRNEFGFPIKQNGGSHSDDFKDRPI